MIGLGAIGTENLSTGAIDYIGTAGGGGFSTNGNEQRSLFRINTLTAGTTSYRVQFRSSSVSSGTVHLERVQLVVYNPTDGTYSLFAESGTTTTSVTYVTLGTSTQMITTANDSLYLLNIVGRLQTPDPETDLGNLSLQTVRLLNGSVVTGGTEVLTVRGVYSY
jgi:hypothetical protein